MREAVKQLDICFKRVALEEGVTIGEVINAFYNVLNPGYDVYCAILDPEECAASIMCTPYNDSCVPIFVKDYKIINDDPDDYIEKLDTVQLRNLRDVAAHLYYNVGDSGIEDNSFDAIDYHLRKRLKKEYDVREPIGAIPIEKLRVDLPYALPSLNKVKPDEKAYAQFLGSTPAKGLIWSDKLDGVSGMVVYEGRCSAEALHAWKWSNRGRYFLPTGSYFDAGG